MLHVEAIWPAYISLFNGALNIEANFYQNICFESFQTKKGQTLGCKFCGKKTFLQKFIRLRLRLSDLLVRGKIAPPVLPKKHNFHVTDSKDLKKRFLGSLMGMF